MKYIQRTSKNIKENFLVELLADRGLIPSVSDWKNFIYTTKNHLLNWNLLDNIKEGANLLVEHLENNKKIYIVIDPDVDGFTSAAVLYNFIERNFRPKYPNFTLDYHIPDGKQHGLESVMSELEKEKIYDLIILPDSSSNDYEYHKILSDMGYKILVIDHHLASHYSEDAIVVNNQLSENYPNKELSGVGVVFKFISLLDDMFHMGNCFDYLDLVAMGICGDMCPLTTLENRFISDYGFSHIYNKGFQELIKLQSYSLFGSSDIITDESFNTLEKVILTPMQVAFYIVPLINALIRVGTEKDKEMLFKSFICGEELVESTKRGHKGEMETIATQSARNCTNARNRQNREKDKALELLDIQIMNDCLDENKILILNADDLDISNTLTGLCAMGVAAKYKKPVLLGRIGNDGYLKGSMRGQNDSELKDFREFLLNSNYMDYVEG